MHPNTAQTCDAGEGREGREASIRWSGPWALFSSKVSNSKKNFRHLHEELNLDEIKNALRLLSVNGETNIINLIRL